MNPKRWSTKEWRWTLAAASVLAAAGCGQVDLGQRLGDALAKVATEAAVEAVESGIAADDLVALAGGVDGVAPDLEALNAEFGGGAGVGLAPGFRPQGAETDCNAIEQVGFPQDKICRVSGARDIPEGPRSRETWWALVYFPDAPTGDTAVIIDMGGEWTFRDGSTASVEITDLEAPDGTTAADMGHHWIAIEVTRHYPEDARIERDWALLEVRLNGTFDDADEPGDQPDELRAATFERRFANGRVQRIEILPEAPILAREDAAAGTVTKTTTYPDGPLGESVETLHWRRDPEWAQGTKVLSYADGTTAYEQLEITPDAVHVHAVGRKGVRKTVTVDRTNGAYTKELNFPEGHPIVSITESGRIQHEGAGLWHVELERTTTWRNGETRIVTASIDHDAANHRTDIAYTKETTAGVETGEVTVVRNLGSRDLTARIERPNGNMIEIEATVYEDGSATLHATLDKPETERSPDVTIDFESLPDGSGSGTITIGDRTYLVHRDADGTVTVAPLEPVADEGSTATEG